MDLLFNVYKLQLRKYLAFAFLRNLPQQIHGTCFPRSQLKHVLRRRSTTYSGVLYNNRSVWNNRTGQGIFPKINKRTGLS